MADDPTTSNTPSNDNDPSSSSTSSSSKKSKASSGNCSGELKELPAEPGRAYNRYECQSCHQVVTVSHEDLELSGLPPEHSPTPVGE